MRVRWKCGKVDKNGGFAKLLGRLRGLSMETELPDSIEVLVKVEYHEFLVVPI